MPGRTSRCGHGRCAAARARSGRREAGSARAGAASGTRSAAGGSPVPEAELDTRGQALFEALRRWRLATARRDGVPPYVVASDRSRRDVALLRPRSLDELLLCHGIGPTKARQHGASIPEVVRTEGSSRARGAA